MQLVRFGIGCDVEQHRFYPSVFIHRVVTSLNNWSLQKTVALLVYNRILIHLWLKMR